ncbi:hypothetical protein GCM10011387_26630 [Pedobacter quisquiliarum]|uniref:3-methyladenine DNA glycosylase AlkC n=1 Tax=Pedobacter quisquiliarum TaxID=1834438 RepID=A0A916XHY5_9SPHI|nr:DNA alkylation repair protein [Pedobacter quisquiliarum]GGC71770.1 hypothetical protein GCM10011387_26630 [Pedobacter quisquiliarum]
MSLLKDLYTPVFYNGIASCMQETLLGFDTQLFLEYIYVPAFETMELKARMKHTAMCMHQFMPASYSDAMVLLVALIERLKAHGFLQERLEMMFLPAYIETYGLKHPQASIESMEIVTQYVSCEFAIRPFLNAHFEQTLNAMQVWTQHEHARVRRLATEGCRPRLPWGLAVDRLKKDPSPILPILEALKADTDEAVRRSVANNLNDISKDHPDVVLAIVKAWSGNSRETDAIIKHGCRTLLKRGHTHVLEHYGLNAEKIILENFELLTPEVKIGGLLSFKFQVGNVGDKAKTIRLEYAIYYRKANGQLNRKVFKISERIYQAGQLENISRNQSFKLISTRKYYEGEHAIEVLINGSVMAEGNYMVRL